MGVACLESQQSLGGRKGWVDIFTLTINQNVIVNVNKQCDLSKVIGHIKSFISSAKKKNKNQQDLKQQSQLLVNYEEMGIQRFYISDLENLLT